MVKIKMIKKLILVATVVISMFAEASELYMAGDSIMADTGL